MNISPKPTIGWIGAGRMGFQLATRLLEGGHDVTVYNRTRAKAEPLVVKGAKVVDRPSDLAGLDVVFIMVSAPKDLEEVTMGEFGLLTVAGKSPKVVIDSSTVSTEVSEKVRAYARSKGTELLAAPVSGNPAVIAAGKLTVAVSGPKDVYEQVAELINLFGRKVTYVGEGEVARLVKIAHNIMLGVVTQTLAEIVTLTEKAGVERAAFLEFLNDSVMGSTFTKYKSPSIVNLDFTPTFTVPLLLKDFDLGLDAAHTLEVPMPITAAAQQITASARGAGHLEEDFMILLIEQARRAGMTLVSENKKVLSGLEVDGDEQ
jgi:3-hydroxyisobutyrate dehydrogenase-like beta-hydroxyacid dehydrogenase